MQLISRVAGAIALAAALVHVAAASAQDNRPYIWTQIRTEQGCLIYMARGREFSEAEYQRIMRFSFEGSGCQPGRVLSGEGTLVWHASPTDATHYRGRIVNGVLEGSVEVTNQSSRGVFSHYTSNFVGGCELIWQDGRCRPFTGAAARAAAPATRVAAQQAQAIRQTNGPLQGSSNLACVVFQPGTGPNARSSLVNRCGEEVRINYCLQYRNGADNCAPMSTGHQATLWPVRAGQSLTMPAADTLRLWAVFGCRVPLYPVNVVFRNRQLIDGICVEDGLAPPSAQPGQRIVRSNDPSTWPPGYSNRPCLRLNPQLNPGRSAYLIQDCGTDQNVVACGVPNGARLSIVLCASGAVSNLAPTLVPQGGVVILGPPNSYNGWAAFACDAPAVPDQLDFDGARLTGTCRTS